MYHRKAMGDAPLATDVWSRRQVVKTGTAAAVGAAVSGLPWRSAWAAPNIGGGHSPIENTAVPHTEASLTGDAFSASSHVDPAVVKALALQAVDAARSSGASYADVRLTREHTRGVSIGLIRDVSPDEQEMLSIGVRALVNGSWGFAGSPIWTQDEAVRLGREAVAQAKIDASAQHRPVELGTIPVVRDGTWVMPVEIDPFTVPVDEIVDYLRSLTVYTELYPGSRLIVRCQFIKTEKSFASTEGAYCAQTTYNTGCNCTILYGLPRKNFSSAAGADVLSPAGRGWEYIANAGLRDKIHALIDGMTEDASLPVEPTDPGRYTVLFDAATTARLLDHTIGAATELDRAMGLEANAGGTSYLDDPLAMVGQQTIGAPLLTVTANRSLPGGVGTVRWDDEGVEPNDFTLVRSGTLVDFQTTRESAAWLAPYYNRIGQPVRSHGCSYAAAGLDIPLSVQPNLTLVPSSDSASFDDLLASVDNGILIMHGNTMTDFQALNGVGMGHAYRIRQGKRVARMPRAVYQFRAPQFWKNFIALGGRTSAEEFGLQDAKGEPSQGSWHTVRSVPSVVKEVQVSEVAGIL